MQCIVRAKAPLCRCAGAFHPVIGRRYLAPHQITSRAECNIPHPCPSVGPVTPLASYISVPEAIEYVEFESGTGHWHENWRAHKRPLAMDSIPRAILSKEERSLAVGELWAMLDFLRLATQSTMVGLRRSVVSRVRGKCRVPPFRCKRII